MKRFRAEASGTGTFHEVFGLGEMEREDMMAFWADGLGAGVRDASRVRLSCLEDMMVDEGRPSVCVL